MSTPNEIIEQINALTGYKVPTSSFVYTTGSVPEGATVYVVPQTPASGTISTEGIYPGAVIKADHVLRIINALNGTANNEIIISGSLYVSGSSTMASSLNLPFVPNENLIESANGSMEATDKVDGGTF
jgi:hypothetical protein